MVLDFVAAVLSAVGILAILWLLLGRLLLPTGAWEGAALYAVLPAAGVGGHLEQDVKALRWLADCRLVQWNIVIADAGLTPEGRALAARLCMQEDAALCPLEELSAYIRAHSPE